MTVTISTIKEKIQEGEDVYYLTFRFSTGLKKNELQKVHSEIEARGWQKVPDLENTYVWFGDDKPPNVMDILKKNSFENHTCRVLTGILTSADLFEGTGTLPKKSEKNEQASVSTEGNTSLHDFFPRVKKADDHEMM